MATGSLLRWSTSPVVKMTVTSGGTNLDLTDYDIKFLLWWESTLSTAIDTATTTSALELPAAAFAVVESGDVCSIEHERLQVEAIPAADPAGTCSYTVSRGYDYSATPGKIYASTVVAGTGTSIFNLGDNATFNLTIDAASAKTVTVTETATSTCTTMANLVTAIAAAVDSACTTVSGTVASIANRIYIQSDTTGVTSKIIVASPNDTCTAELGIVADTDYGESSVTSDAGEHAVSTVVKIMKIEADARISDATGGVVEYEWDTNDTDMAGIFYAAFQLKSDQGRYFTLPHDKSFTIEIKVDPNDRNILDGE